MRSWIRILLLGLLALCALAACSSGGDESAPADTPEAVQTGESAPADTPAAARPQFYNSYATW